MQERLQYCKDSFVTSTTFPHVETSNVGFRVNFATLGCRMSFSRRLAGVLAVSISLGQGAQAACDPITVPPDDLQSFERMLNATRAEVGLTPLRFDRALARASADYACVMAETGHFDHVGPDSSQPRERAARFGYRYCSLGENLAIGMSTLSYADKGWRNSPAHFANYLSDRARDYAVAAAAATGLAGATYQSGGGFASLADRHGGLVMDGGGAAPFRARGPVYWVMLVGSAGC